MSLEPLLAPFTNPSLLLELLWIFGGYLILATSIDLATGYTGLFQLGHVGFFALGALGSTYATHPEYFGADLLAGILFGMVLTTAAIILIGIPTLRLGGDYFAIATLGFGVIVQSILAGVYANGIFGIPTFNPFGCDLQCMLDAGAHHIFGSSPRSQRVLELVIVWVAAFGVHAIAGRIKRSPMGRALKSIREDPMAAAAMGKDVQMLRFQALWASALMASLAGSLTVHHFQSMSPLGYGFPFMVLILVMAILGGLGSHHGALLGALIVTFLNQASVGVTEVLRDASPGFAARFDLPALRLMLFASILIVLMIFRPGGILGDTDRRLRDLWRRP